MVHVNTADQASVSATAPPNGRKVRGGGNLSPLFPNRLVIWVDDDLAAAVKLATKVEKERDAVVLRRWLRRAAVAEGFYRPQERA